MIEKQTLRVSDSVQEELADLAGVELQLKRLSLRPGIGLDKAEKQHCEIGGTALTDGTNVEPMLHKGYDGRHHAGIKVSSEVHLAFGSEMGADFVAHHAKVLIGVRLNRANDCGQLIDKRLLIIGSCGG